MAGNLVLVRTESQYQLTSTFLRFQEHYESPKFRGKIFSFEEFADWYAKENGNFTYYEDWYGMNIPSHIFRTFREGKFNPLSPKEKKLLDLLAPIPEPFYLVGLYGKKMDLPDLKHELVHGLYFTVPSYRKDVLAKLKRSDCSSMHEALGRAGYHPSVRQDETNAYYMMGANTDLKEAGFKLTQSGRELQKELRQIFRTHFGFSLQNAREEKILKYFQVLKLGG